MKSDPVATWWLIAGFTLVISEFFAPAFILIFLGAAAIITGGLILIGLPQHSAIPYATFAGSSVLLIVLLRKAAQKRFKGLDAKEVNVNPGFDDIVGKDAVVVSGFASADAQGRVSLRGTEWDAVTNERLQIGDKVRVQSHEGHKLHVTKM